MVTDRLNHTYEELKETLKKEEHNVVALVSGGRDSTAMVLLAKENEIDLTMLFGDTGMNRPFALEILNRISEYTGYELKTAKYEGKKPPIKIVEESFYRIPQAIEAMKKTGKYVRNMFPCCNILKHRPMNTYTKEHFQDSILLLGLKISDGAINRYYRMKQLQEWDTQFRRHVKSGLLYYYPLRDLKEIDIEEVLSRHGFQDVKSTGCRICPIFCMFPNWVKKDASTWLASRAFGRKLNIKFPLFDQQTITRYCIGGN